MGFFNKTVSDEEWLAQTKLILASKKGTSSGIQKGGHHC